MSQLAASPSRRPAKPVSLLSSRQLGLRWLERSTCVLLFFAIWEFLPRAGLVNSAFLSPPSAVLAAIVQLAQTGQLAPLLEAAPAPARSEEGWILGAGHAALLQQAGRHHRRDGDRDDARDDDGPRQRHRKLAKQRAGQAAG